MSACGNSSFLDKDPLAFLSGDSKKKKAEEKEKLALRAQPPDLFTNVMPLEMKKGGALGSLGLNLETYFAGEITSEDRRMERLEKAVIAMHKDLKIMVPALQRLSDVGAAMKGSVNNAAIQPSSQVSLKSPQSLLKQDAAPVDRTPPPAAMAHKASGAVVPGGAMVSGLRTGEHADKVRIVFDVSKKNTSYTANVDNNENILVVELPNARWKTSTDYQIFKAMPVLKSYKVDTLNNGQGNIFVLQLKKSTQILAQGKYPALSGGGERIVIDLAK